VGGARRHVVRRTTAVGKGRAESRPPGRPPELAVRQSRFGEAVRPIPPEPAVRPIYSRAVQPIPTT
jgi:hypothetical protein